ncbi:MAG: acyl-CoA carboxylase subunit beta [Desulfomonilia bacterium]
MAFEKLIEELQEKKDRVLVMGGPHKITKQHEKGRLTARERIDRMLDPGSFFELGMLACSDMPGMEDKTPGDGIILGFGTINGKRVGITASDFTVLAATLSRVHGKKLHDFKQQIYQYKLPHVFLGDGGGGRVPDGQGSIGMTSSAMMGTRSIFLMYTNHRQAPMITAIMGNCFGVPMWQACAADFVVQVKGSTLSVSGARALQKIIAATYTDEDMGGWKIQAEHTGIVDRTAEDEEDCFRIIREFLSYMPQNNRELPPRHPVPEDSGRNMGAIMDILPEKRTRAYDMYKIILSIVDSGSLFDLKPLFGKTIITSLARIDGRSVGIVANQPMVNGGAMGTDALEKLTGFLCLCDSYNIPLLFLHDSPGFLVGKEAELKKVGAKVTNAMDALSQVTVPKVSIIIRKSYGQGMFSMCGPSAGPDFVVAWPSAEISFLDPVVAADVACGQLPEEEYQTLKNQMIQEAGPGPAAGRYFLQDIIDPRETRTYLMNVLDIIADCEGGGIGNHLLANWPKQF